MTKNYHDVLNTSSTILILYLLRDQSRILETLWNEIQSFVLPKGCISFVQKSSYLTSLINCSFVIETYRECNVMLMDRGQDPDLWKVRVIMKYLTCKWKKSPLLFGVSNVFKSAWHREAEQEMICLRMANYPVTWNITSVTYAEEKLKVPWIKAGRTGVCQPNLSKKEMGKLCGCQILYQDNKIAQYTLTF